MATRVHLLRRLTIALLVVSLFLTACGAPTPKAGGDTPPDQPATPGELYVESVDILIMESFPVQISVLVKGQLPNVCTEIDQIRQGDDLENNAFWIEITTVSSTDDACIEILAPFEESIPLDVYGLPAGTYTVTVNDVMTATFTLDMDNVPSQAAPAPFTIS